MPDEPRGIRARFMDWLNGVSAPPIDLLELSRRPAASTVHTDYPTKTVSDRLHAWRGKSGGRTYNHIYNTLSAIVCISLVFVLLFTVSTLPPFGQSDNPTNNEVPRKYIEDGVKDTGALNVVAGMILDYRAFDTFGEASVLFVAVGAILVLLQKDGTPMADILSNATESRQQNVIMQTTAFLLVPIIMVYGCYVVLNGHLSPGGGFSGGAILGASLILYACAFGTERANRFMNFKFYRDTVSACLMFYAISKSYSFYKGANDLPSIIPTGTPGNLISSGLILPLNIAVGLIVACTVYVLFTLFSKES